MRRVAMGVLVLFAGACTAPVRQYDIMSSTLTCEQANEYAYRTLEAMKFSITAFEPAAVGRTGVVRGSRDTTTGGQAATVRVTCNGQSVVIDASEDGRLLGQSEFKRGYYMSFTGLQSQEEIRANAAAAEEARPFAAKREKGVQVLLEPVRGLQAKLDFDLDLAAGGILPVKLEIKNVTERAYRLDLQDVVLVRADGQRVPPLATAEAAAQVVAALRGQGVALTDDDVRRRLAAHEITDTTVPSTRSVSGYLYYPLASYVKGRVVLEDPAAEESEGFVFQF
jgi:hypothetical protein